MDSKPFGADKGQKGDVYDGFGDSDDEESEDVEDDQAEGVCCCWPCLSRGKGASNKYTSSKVLQTVFPQGFASAKCMYFCKLLQICFHTNTKVWQAFTNMNYMIWQAFARFRAN